MAEQDSISENEWPAGGGEMAAFVRSYNWARSPLGATGKWPPALKHAASLVLANGVPMSLAWGADRIQIYNEAFRRLLGDQHPAAFGRPIFDALSGQDRAASEELYRRAALGETISLTDQTYTLGHSSDGAERWFDVCFSPVRDESGAVGGVLLTLSETTCRVQAEKRKQEAERRLREREAREDFILTLFDRMRALSEPREILSTGCEALAARLRVPFVSVCECASNRTALILASHEDGYGPRTRGRTIAFTDLFDGFEAGIKTGEAFYLESVALAGEDSRSLTGAAAAFPLMRDGRTAAFLLLMNPEPRVWKAQERTLIHAVAGRIWGAFERARAEAATRASEARLRSVFDLNLLGVVFGNPVTGSITDANDEYLRIIGGSREDLVSGKLNWKAITPPEFMEPEPARAVQTAEPGLVLKYEKEYMRPDGSRVPVIVGRSHLDTSGERCVGFVLDVSERKRNEERLLQAERLESVGTLAAGISHEFNNILTSILGNASIALSDGGHASADQIREIEQGARRAAHLVRQLSAYCGKGQFIVRDLDIAETLNAVVVTSRNSLPANIAMRLEVEPGLPTALMDPEQFQQMLLNLVANAAEAIGTARPGVIQVSCHRTGLAEAFLDAVGNEVEPGLYVCIEVKDNGCGIDNKELGRIFEPFVSTKFTGRGLGLAAVAGIVRFQKGGITVDSAPGEGSLFRVFLRASGS